MIKKKINILDEEIFFRFFEWKKASKTILILHWWWGKSLSWLEIWKKLSEKWFQVFIPDLPGHWESSLNKIFDIDLYSNLVSEFLEKNKIKDFSLIAHSNWWKISLNLLEKKSIFPEKIILIWSSGIKNSLNFKQKIWKFLAKTLKKLPIPLFLIKIFYKIIWWQDYFNASQKAFLKETFLNCLNLDLEKKLPNILQKINLIWWSKDSYTPLFMWKKMNKLLKNSTLKVLNWEKHWIHLQNPEKLFDEIQKILK